MIKLKMVGALSSDLEGALCSGQVGAVSSDLEGAVWLKFPVIVHKSEGDIEYEGRHKPLVSREMFNAINSKSPIKKRNNNGEVNENSVLRNFIFCGICITKYTYYLKKKFVKNGIAEYHFYKCNKEGCQCNIKTAILHESFERELQKLEINSNLIVPLKRQINLTINYLFEAVKNKKKELNTSLTNLKKEESELENDYYRRRKDMPKEFFEKTMAGIKEQKRAIETELFETEQNLSNQTLLENQILEPLAKLGCWWSKMKSELKAELQKLIFPEGMMYFHKNGFIEPIKTNPIFTLFSDLAGQLGGIKNGTNQSLDEKSRNAPSAGLEPATL